MRLVNKLLALFLAFTIFAPWAIADSPAVLQGPPVGWLPSLSGVAPLDASYFTLSSNSNLTNERVLTFSVPQFSVSDNGPGNTYVVGLGPILSYWYGTGATTNQTAFNAISNLPSSATGDIFYKNSATTVTRLPIGTAGQFLKVNAGATAPEWGSGGGGGGGAPDDVHYVVTQGDGALANAHVVDDGDGTTANIGTGTLAIDVDSTVVRTTGAQSLAGPKTLSGGPIVADANTDGLNLEGSVATTTIVTDPGSNQTVTIPAVGTSSFVMTAGAQTIGGIKTLSAAPVLSTGTLTAGANLQTFPSSAQTLVGRTSSDTMTNKELTSPSFTNNATGMTLKGSSSNTFVIDWAPGATGQTLSLPNPNGNVDIAYKSGAATAGGVAQGAGNNTINFSNAGSSGQPFLSGGSSTGSFGTLGVAGGGTGITSGTAGDIFYFSGPTTVSKLPIGTAGQSLKVNSGATAPEWSSGGSGTVTSVAASGPTGIATWSSAVTTSGTLTQTLSNQNANTHLSGPASGSATTPTFRVNAIGDYTNLPICNGGRICLASNDPRNTDTASASTLYWSPDKHGVISLWDGSQYVNVLPGEISLSLSGSSGEYKSIYGTLSGGTLALSASAAWTNATTRGFTINRDSSGVLSLSTDRTKRWLADVFFSGTNQVTFNSSLAGMFNADNRIPVVLSARDATNSWTYTTNTFRPFNNSTTNGTGRVTFLVGDTTAVRATVVGNAAPNTGAAAPVCNVAIGLDSTSAKATDVVNGRLVGLGGGNSPPGSITASFGGMVTLGGHYLTPLESSNSTGTTTWYGDNGGTDIQSGMTVWLDM